MVTRRPGTAVVIVGPGTAGGAAAPPPAEAAVRAANGEARHGD